MGKHAQNVASVCRYSIQLLLPLNTINETNSNLHAWWETWSHLAEVAYVHILTWSADSVRFGSFSSCSLRRYCTSQSERSAPSASLDLFWRSEVPLISDSSMSLHNRYKDIGSDHSTQRDGKSTISGHCISWIVHISEWIVSYKIGS